MSKTYKYKLEAEASLKSLFESISEDSVQFERERIIRLLKEAQQSQPCQCDDCGDHIWDKAIALIKEGQE